jgi:hypothetical protein
MRGTNVRPGICFFSHLIGNEGNKNLVHGQRDGSIGVTAGIDHSIAFSCQTVNSLFFTVSVSINSLGYTTSNWFRPLICLYFQTLFDHVSPL